MAISGRQSLQTNFAQGNGVLFPGILTTGVSVTAGAAASGFFTAQIRANNIGSTMPGTVQSFLTPASLSTELFAHFGISGNSQATLRNMTLVRLYRFGTMSAFTPTGDRFSHDAATFPVTRTQFGATSQPLTLIPMIQITTATTTTAAVMRLRTAAGGTGYVDQDGNNVVATKTMTMPAAATAAGTCLIWRLEDGDSGVRDVAAVEVTTAAAAGAATIWGIEFLMHLGTHITSLGTSRDPVFAGLEMVNMEPAVATSGSATTRLALIDFSANTAGGNIWFAGGVNA